MARVGGEEAIRVKTRVPAHGLWLGTQIRHAAQVAGPRVEKEEVFAVVGRGQDPQPVQAEERVVDGVGSALRRRRRPYDEQGGKREEERKKRKKHLHGFGVVGLDAQAAMRRRRRRRRKGEWTTKRRRKRDVSEQTALGRGHAGPTA